MLYIFVDFRDSDIGTYIAAQKAVARKVQFPPAFMLPGADKEIAVGRYRWAKPSRRTLALLRVQVAKSDHPAKFPCPFTAFIAHTVKRLGNHLE